MLRLIATTELWSAGSCPPCSRRWYYDRQHRGAPRNGRTRPERHDANENLGTPNRCDRAERKICARRNRPQKICCPRGTALLGTCGDRSVYRLGDRQADRGGERIECLTRENQTAALTRRSPIIDRFRQENFGGTGLATDRFRRRVIDNQIESAND